MTMAVTGSRQAALERAKARHRATLERARESCGHFVEYAMRHERDGRQLRNAPFHWEWQRLLEAHNQVVLFAPVEHAKTQQVAVGKSLHMLGRDPELRIGIISNTESQGQKILRAIKGNIERNDYLHEVFPELAQSPHAEDPWHGSAITVRRKTVSKDPSVQVCGAYGPLVGSRLDVIIVDDVLDFENTRTKEQREKLMEWWETTVMTRATRGCRIYVIGTPWHPDDLLHSLGALPAFHRVIYSAVENPDDPPDRWRPIWKEEWDLPRLLERRENTTEAVFLRKYLCRVRAATTGRIREEWLTRCLRLGMGRGMYREAPVAQGGVRKLPCFTGVDLGVGQGTASAETVLFTIALENNGRRLICEVQAGRWTAPEILDRLESVYRRFGSTIAVESNGAQQFLVQLAAERFPVLGLHTGANKHHEEFGVESLAVELRAGMWVIPSGVTGDAPHPEVRAWLEEMLHYSPELHTGDRLMASWVAREVARKHGAPMVQRLPAQNR